MTSLNISLPQALKEYLENQVRDGSYSTSSEYIRALLREDQKRRTQGKLEDALLEGVNSGAPTQVSSPYWSRKRRELTSRHKAPKAAR